MMVTPKQSQQVQEICFANGIGWWGNCKKVEYVHMPYLFINKVYLTYCDTDEFFKEKENEEVDASLFIRTNGTCVEETPKQELKQNKNKEETMEKNEVESYADVKEYLIAKGLYERVLEIDWETYEEDTFSGLFTWANTEERHNFWDELNNEMLDLDIEEKIESLVQDYKAKQGKEFIKHIETQPEEAIETKPKPTSYINVKEYLIAKGLYERVLEIDWDCGGEPIEFSELFIWYNAKEGFDFWNDLDNDLIRLKINQRIESLVQDYEAQPEEAIEAQSLEKPKQYLCYVQGKALPKHIHKTLEQAKQEAQRLCRKELAKVSVLEVVAEYEAQVLVKEVL